MLFAVMLEDEPKNADARPKHRGAHQAYLEKNLDKVRDAGPLLDPTSGASLGGMWLVEAENEGDVRKIVENDPFYHAGLRKSVRIAWWKLVFSGGKKVASAQ
jgi:uncharacterized protein